MEIEAFKGLEPERVFEIFADISQIPRGSGNEKEISDYIKRFAENLGLPVYQDEAWNLIIRKPATEGYENAPITVLQAHLDMVCQKDEGVEHDFTKDPIHILRDGDVIHADGTTLGADDGTGLAFCMAVLESKTIKSPELEVVLTSNEEAGMTGIKRLDMSKIKGRVFINLDCSDYGIVVGCAGTAAIEAKLSVRRETAGKPENNAGRTSVKTIITGLKGGHSGLDIGKQRANANVLMARLLSNIADVCEIGLEEYSGGSAANAITRTCKAQFAVRRDDLDEVSKLAEKFQIDISKEFRESDPDIKVIVEETLPSRSPVTAEDTKKILNLLLLIPNGVEARSLEVDGLPETSGNMGKTALLEESFRVLSLYRSCFGAKKRLMLKKFFVLAKILGAEVEVQSDDPEWEYNKNSRLSQLIQDTFLQEYGEQLVVEVSHGGNECGTFFCNFPDADIVCTGTQITGAHTTQESVTVPVIQKEWHMLVKELENMRNY